VGRSLDATAAQTDACLKRLRLARVISVGHAFVQNLRGGHYELGLDANPRHRLPAVFTELARAI
jgi:hypothetical protein